MSVIKKWIFKKIKIKTSPCWLSFQNEMKKQENLLLKVYFKNILNVVLNISSVDATFMERDEDGGKTCRSIWGWCPSTPPTFASPRWRVSHILLRFTLFHQRLPFSQCNVRVSITPVFKCYLLNLISLFSKNAYRTLLSGLCISWLRGGETREGERKNKMANASRIRQRRGGWRGETEAAGRGLGRTNQRAGRTGALVWHSAVRAVRRQCAAGRVANRSLAAGLREFFQSFFFSGVVLPVEAVIGHSRPTSDFDHGFFFFSKDLIDFFNCRVLSEWPVLTTRVII